MLLAGDHKQQCILQVRRGEGYAQYGGMPFVMSFPFHITQTEFKRRRDEAKWPEAQPGTICPELPRTMPRHRTRQLFLAEAAPAAPSPVLEDPAPPASARPTTTSPPPIAMPMAAAYGRFPRRRKRKRTRTARPRPRKPQIPLAKRGAGLTSPGDVAAASRRR